MSSPKKAQSLKPGSLPYIWRNICKNPGAVAGMVVIGLLIVISITSPLYMPSYSAVDVSNRYALPSFQHLFGCDELGRDIMARVFYGVRYTLFIGLAAVAISASIGILFGAISGYFGGAIDNVIMRFLDIFQAFPELLLAIALSAVLGTGLDKCILAIGIAGIPSYARLMRANILSIRSQEFIEAAITNNCTQVRIILRHAIPNAISPLLVQISLSIASAGLASSSLSFIGLGVQPPEPEWGAMLSTARGFIRQYPHMVLFPGLFIAVTVICFNLIGDALRDALDPKLKK